MRQYTSNERNAWWTTIENSGFAAGYLYSRIGNGDRLSSLQPNGANSAQIIHGFNQAWDLGAGFGVNRTSVGSNSGDWPNIIRLNLTSTNVVTQGDTGSLFVYYQWAKSSLTSLTAQFFLDEDWNPLNGNEHLLVDGTAPGTTADLIGSGTVDVSFNATNALIGYHAIFAKFSDGQNSRYLYAPELLQVVANTQPLILDATHVGTDTITIGVNGTAGQTIVLEVSMDGSPWLPLATNTLAGARWEIVEPIESTAELTLFRAVLVNP